MSNFLAVGGGEGGKKWLDQQEYVQNKIFLLYIIGVLNRPGVYNSVWKRHLFPPPFWKLYFSPSRDTSFFYFHRGLFALILPYSSFILSFYLPFYNFLSPFFLFFTFSPFFSSPFLWRLSWLLLGQGFGQYPAWKHAIITFLSNTNLIFSRCFKNIQSRHDIGDIYRYRRCEKYRRGTFCWYFRVIKKKFLLFLLKMIHFRILRIRKLKIIFTFFWCPYFGLKKKDDENSLFFFLKRQWQRQQLT